MKGVKGEAQSAYLLRLLPASPRPLRASQLLERVPERGLLRR